MAIQVNGTQVIGNSRELTNIASVDATTVATLGAAGVGGSALNSWNPGVTPDQTFTSSGTWTKPGNVSSSAFVVFYMVGGGSSGGHYYGGPGGFGGCASILTATMGGLPSSVSIVVGAGGARQTNFLASVNPGGATTVSANGITYSALGAPTNSTPDGPDRPVPQVIFPTVEAPFAYTVPAVYSCAPGIIPTTLTNNVENGHGAIFAGADGGHVNPNASGTGGTSTYAGNGGAGNVAYGQDGYVPGGGGGGSYTGSTATGGAGGNGSVRVYYIT